MSHLRPRLLALPLLVAVSVAASPAAAAPRRIAAVPGAATADAEGTTLLILRRLRRPGCHGDGAVVVDLRSGRRTVSCIVTAGDGRWFVDAASDGLRLTSLTGEQGNHAYDAVESSPLPGAHASPFSDIVQEPEPGGDGGATYGGLLAEDGVTALELEDTSLVDPDCDVFGGDVCDVRTERRLVLLTATGARRSAVLADGARVEAVGGGRVVVRDGAARSAIDAATGVAAPLALEPAPGDDARLLSRARGIVAVAPSGHVDVYDPASGARTAAWQLPDGARLVDVRGGRAFAVAGARLLVLDLATGRARRLLVRRDLARASLLRATAAGLVWVGRPCAACTRSAWLLRWRDVDAG